jgi:hypothetical protein
LLSHLSPKHLQFFFESSYYVKRTKKHLILLLDAGRSMIMYFDININHRPFSNHSSVSISIKRHTSNFKEYCSRQRSFCEFQTGNFPSDGNLKKSCQSKLVAKR